MPADYNCASAVAMDDEIAGSVGHDGRAAGCSCLPFCFWGTRSRGSAAAPERRRRRRRRFGLRLSWFSWPWLRKSRGGKEEEAGKKNKGKRRRRLLLLLLTSLQAKKALASVSSGSSLLPKLQVSSIGGAKKQNWSKPRRTVDDAAPTTSCAETAPAWPETIGQPCPRPAGGNWRAPSRLHSLQHYRGGAEPGAGGLWTAATTLGVIVFFGRVTAVFFLCSCLYGARWFGARAGSVDARSGIAGAGGNRRLSDRMTADLCKEEYKKKVVMDGLLDRAGARGRRHTFVNNQQQLVL